jgi:hypothetical protein
MLPWLLLRSYEPGLEPAFEDAPCAGLLDRPHSLALSRSCAVEPPPALGGGDASVVGRPPALRLLW